MDVEKQDAIRRLTSRLLDHVYQVDPEKVREAQWSFYLLWLLNEALEADKEMMRRHRKRTLRDLDRLYRRLVTCDDLVQIARMHGCDMFDVVLLVPTITGDLPEMRSVR